MNATNATSRTTTKAKTRRMKIARGGGIVAVASSFATTSTSFVVVTVLSAMMTISVMVPMLPSHSFVEAFVGVDRVRASVPCSSSSSSSSSFGIYANKDDDVDPSSSSSSSSSSETAKKLAIPTITDENSHSLLHPTDHPNRPILIDAFAPWCGPCKLLDKVLRKAQPKYKNKIDFCRWNVNDAEATVKLRESLIERGYVLNKLPSLIVFRDGVPVAMRPGFSNEYQLDDFLERTLPDVLERTFDEHGVKMVPMMMSATIEKGEEEEEVTTTMTTTTTTTTTCLEVKEDCTVVEGNVVKEEICEIVVVESECDSESVAVVVSSSAIATEGMEDGEMSHHRVDDCVNERDCYERLEMTVWKDRIVVPAMDGIGSFLPSRVKS